MENEHQGTAEHIQMLGVPNYRPLYNKPECEVPILLLQSRTGTLFFWQCLSLQMGYTCSVCLSTVHFLVQGQMQNMDRRLQLYSPHVTQKDMVSLPPENGCVLTMQSSTSISSLVSECGPGLPPKLGKTPLEGMVLKQ